MKHKVGKAKGHIWFWWRSPRECWAVAIRWPFWWGRCHSPYVRSWNFGPFCLCHTNLDRF